jgi:hypothetical protein
MQSIKVRKVFFIFWSLSIFKLLEWLSMTRLARKLRRALAGASGVRSKLSLIERKKVSSRKNSLLQKFSLLFARLNGVTEAGGKSVL